MDDISRREALFRLKRTLTKQQIEDLQIVIKNTKAAGDYTGMDDDGGSFWEESISSTLAELAAELNFDNDAFDPDLCNGFCGEHECNKYQEINPKICKRLKGE
jgi:hypothetical protein